MARRPRMTKAEALQDFRETTLARLKESEAKRGYVDDSARREAWNNYTDALCKGGSITLRQYETWSNPF